jgi:AraC-like DNA-binding protein
MSCSRCCHGTGQLAHPSQSPAKPLSGWINVGANRQLKTRPVVRLLDLYGNCPLPTSRKVSPLPKWRLRRAIDFIEAHADGPVALADLAQAAGLTRMYFAAQFRAATGLRPHEYVLRCRIEKAQIMLTTSDAPIADVALTVGFTSQAHFTTVFKRFTSVTPYRWRQHHRL